MEPLAEVCSGAQQLERLCCLEPEVMDVERWNITAIDMYVCFHGHILYIYLLYI